MAVERGDNQAFRHQGLPRSTRVIDRESQAPSPTEAHWSRSCLLQVWDTVLF